MFSSDHFNLNGINHNGQTYGGYPQSAIKTFAIPSKNNVHQQMGTMTSYHNQMVGNLERQIGNNNGNIQFGENSERQKNGNNGKIQNTFPAAGGRQMFQKVSHENNGEIMTSMNPLGLMRRPATKAYSNTESFAATTSARSSNSVSQNEDDRLKMKQSGETRQEKLYILTGTVERVIKYGKIFQNHFCYFQVIGSVVSIADGKIQFEKTMLLRDKKGPILQLTYYSNATHINIEDFHLGQNLRAVGRMVGLNVMSAITIRAATVEEIEFLPRACYISDYAVSTLCGDGQMQTK